MVICCTLENGTGQTFRLFDINAFVVYPQTRANEGILVLWRTLYCVGDVYLASPIELYAFQCRCFLAYNT